MTVQPITLTEADARRLTERIRTALYRFSTSWADLAERVSEAYERRADLALGYSSWADYATAEFHPAEGLAASVRQQVVGLLSAQGMSPQAISPVVGVDRSTVSRDRKLIESQGVQDAHPAERIDFTTGEVIDQRGETIPPSAATDVEEREPESSSLSPAPRPAPIVGLDGKVYTRPEKPSETAQRVIAEASEKGSRRRPITDAFWEGVYDLGKRADSLKRLTEDLRFASNREAIAAKNLAEMKRAASTLAEVLAAVDHE